MDPNNIYAEEKEDDSPKIKEDVKVSPENDGQEVQIRISNEEQNILNLFEEGKLDIDTYAE